MTTGTWQPAAAPAPTLTATDIAYMVEHAAQAATIIQQAPLAEKSAIMKQDKSYWLPHIEPLSDNGLWALIQFFCLAEEADSQWFAGEESAAIYCNQILKQRGQRLTKTQLQWIRANSSNRFIPNGPLKL